MRKSTIFVLLMLLLTTSVYAQQPPPAIDLALADLRQRLGQTVTQDTITNFNWAEDVYGSSALGCPQPDATYTEGQFRAYQFTIEYAGAVYDYRVAFDGSIVVLCESAAPQTTQDAVPTAAPVADTPVSDEAVPTAETVIEPTAISPTPEPVIQAEVVPFTPPPSAGCPGALETRLQAGGAGRNIPGNADINMRQDPARGTEQVAQIPQGGAFLVLEGPQCDGAGFSWWLVDYGGVRGWAAEGSAFQYFLEPIAMPEAVAAPVTEAAVVEETVTEAVEPAAAPVVVLAPNAITSGSAAQVVEIARRSLDLYPMYLELLYPAQLASVVTEGGIALYTVNALDAEPAYLFQEGRSYGLIAYSPVTGTFASVETDSTTLATSIHLWDMSGAPGTVVELGTIALPQAGPVHGLVFSADGQRLALTQEVAGLNVLVYDVNTRATLYEMSFESTPLALTFSADGRWLAVVEPPDKVHIYDVSTNIASNIGFVEGAVNSLSGQGVAFSPDGTRLAVGSNDSVVRLWDTATWTLLDTLQVYDDAITADIAFSPDGSVLAVGGGQFFSEASVENDVQLWDITVTPAVQLAVLEGHTAPTTGLAFTPDGAWLITTAADNTLRAWGLAG